MKFDKQQKLVQRPDYLREQLEPNRRGLNHKKPQEPSRQRSNACHPREPPARQALPKFPSEVYSNSRENAEEVECNMKGCYCQEGDSKPNTVKTDTAPALKSQQKRHGSANPGPTWSQILSQNVGQHSSATHRKEFRKVDVPSRRAGTSHPCMDSGCLNSRQCSRTACIVEEIATRKPDDLLQLKEEVDTAVRNMGLSGNVTKGRKDVTDRPKVVLEYLEELSLEVLKKRLEESESKYSAMRKKTEDVLVAQKLDIQRLKNEISSKNEEIKQLMNVHREASANAISRELALVDRIEMLENRLTNSLEKEEKSSAQCDSYRKEVSTLKLKLSMTAKERDMFRAKMEIYQAERDKAVSSLSVYEKTFKSLKCELGREIDLIKPSPNLTADSCGTLDVTGRQTHELITSSPNTSSVGYTEQYIGRNRISSTPLTKKTERREADIFPFDKPLQGASSSKSSGSPKIRADFDNSKVERRNRPIGNSNLPEGEDEILSKLKDLACQFKKFSDDVIPLAMNLNEEAKGLVNWESLSSAGFGTDVDSQQTIDSASTTMT